MAAGTEKLSAEAKRLSSRGTGAAAFAQGSEVEALVRTIHPISGAERIEIETLGVRVRSVAGTVFSARVPIDQLETLAGLDYVTHIEASRPIRAEEVQNGAEGEKVPLHS